MGGKKKGGGGEGREEKFMSSGVWGETFSACPSLVCPRTLNKVGGGPHRN